jgi:ketosteroid isomerase-like protein
MSGSYPLPTEPEGVVAPLLKRFHSGKISAIMPPYDAEAVFIASNEGTITDHTEIAARLERDLAVCLMVKAKARHVFVAGDIAGIVLDCSIGGTGHDGKHVHLGGSASVIMRRAGDRRLRYLIDNTRRALVRKAAGYMRGTAALTDAAALRPGVDD